MITKYAQAMNKKPFFSGKWTGQTKSTNCQNDHQNITTPHPIIKNLKLLRSLKSKTKNGIISAQNFEDNSENALKVFKINSEGNRNNI